MSTWSDPPAYQRVTVRIEDLVTGAATVWEFPRVQEPTFDIERGDGWIFRSPEWIGFRFKGKAIQEREHPYNYMRMTKHDPPKKPIPGVW